VGLRITSGPVLERKGDLAAILTSLNEGDVFLSTKYTASPCGRGNALFGHGILSWMSLSAKAPAQRPSIFLYPNFTLVGATTRAASHKSLEGSFRNYGSFRIYSEEVNDDPRAVKSYFKSPFGNGRIEKIARRSLRYSADCQSTFAPPAGFCETSDGKKLTLSVALRAA
jgi:Holliday junction DNA helicase RuvB